MAYAIVAVIILILDQAVKYWTTVNIALNDSMSFIPGFIELTNIHNEGAAYGIFKGMTWLFIPLTIIFVIAVIYMLVKNVIDGKFGRWTILMVMAGGIGNLIDRIINGKVVDMFHFVFPVFGRDYPVFNVADMFISICGVLFCIWLIFHKSPKEETANGAPVKKAPKQPVRPVRGPDYMAQLQKPIAEAKVELSSPNRTAEAPVQTLPKSDDVFAEWSASTVTGKAADPISRPAQGAADSQEARPAKASAETNAKKNSDDDFSLESIMAEFKDK